VPPLYARHPSARGESADHPVSPRRESAAGDVPPSQLVEEIHTSYQNFLSAGTEDDLGLLALALPAAED